MGNAFEKVKPKSLEQYGGRPPSEPTDDITKAVCNLMRAGAYIETAAVASGVTKNTLYAWMKKAIVRDEKGRATMQRTDDAYGKFLSAVERAAEECVARDLANIDKAAMGQEPEFERYRYDVKGPDGEIIHRTGDLVLNGRGNPIITKHGFAPDWHASAWRLERRHGKKWGRTETVNQKHSGTLAGPQTSIIVTIPSNGREAVKKKPNE